MTVLTYNPIKNGRVTYFRTQTQRPLSIQKRRYATNAFPIFFILLALVFAVLYMREVFFYSAVAEKIASIQEYNQKLSNQNQSLKNTLSRLESLDSLRVTAEKIGLVKPVNIIYPQETFYTLR